MGLWELGTALPLPVFGFQSVRQQSHSLALPDLILVNKTDPSHVLSPEQHIVDTQ